MLAGVERSRTREKCGPREVEFKHLDPD